MVMALVCINLLGTGELESISKWTYLTVVASNIQMLNNNIWQTGSFNRFEINV